jgi:hypothetical protein
MNALKVSLTTLLLISSSIASAVSPGNDDQKKEMTRILNVSPVLVYLKTGIEKQYGVKCRPYTLESQANEVFRGRMSCLNKSKEDYRPRKIHVTVDGFTIEESPLMITNLRIDFQG